MAGARRRHRVQAPQGPPVAARGAPPRVPGGLRPLACVLLAAALLARCGGPEAGFSPVADDRELLLRIDVNEAGAEELEALPGVGPALASRIVEHRVREGRFAGVEDLLAVRGIGKATLAAMADHLRTGPERGFSGSAE